MAEGKYFVRAKGRITGPFDLPALQKLVSRGLITHVHEISEDRTAWVAAGEYEDLFPGRTARPVQRANAAVSAPAQAGNNSRGTVQVDLPLARESSEGRDPDPASKPASPEMRFYYAQGGTDIGPVSLSVLRNLVLNGTLRPDDMVWREDAQTAQMAQQIPQLASLYTNGYTAAPRSHAAARPIAVPRADIREIHSALERVGLSALVTSVVAALLMLLAFNLPWGRAADGRLLGWWQAFGENDSGGVIFGCILYNLLLFATCLLSPLLRGLSRGIVLISLASAFLIMMLVFVFMTPYPSVLLLGFATVYLVPMLALALGNTARVRRLVPGAPGIRTFQGTVAGGTSILALVVSIVLLISLLEVGKVAVLLSGFVFILIAMLAALAAGVLAFINLKPAFSLSLNMAMTACAFAVPGTLFLGMLLMTMDLTGLMHLATSNAAFDREVGLPNIDRGMFLLGAARMFIICFGFNAILGSGLQEFIFCNFAAKER